MNTSAVKTDRASVERIVAMLRDEPDDVDSLSANTLLALLAEREKAEKERNEAHGRLIACYVMCQHEAIVTTTPEDWSKANLAVSNMSIERDALIAKLATAEAEREALRKDAENRTVCACTLAEPCMENCSCACSILSGGCLRCATYGSIDQQKAQAAWISSHDLLDKVRLDWFHARAFTMYRNRDPVTNALTNHVTLVNEDAKGSRRGILGQTIREAIDAAISAEGR